MGIKVKELKFGAKLIEPDYYFDNRGYSTETMNLRDLKNNGILKNWVLDYQCLNVEVNTIRGIHFQNNPYPQAKMVRVLSGKIDDFVIDLRRNSPTFKQWIKQEISSDNHKVIYIPSGCGHAFITKEPNTVVLYKFDNFYNRELSRAIRWNDPEINLDWDCDNPVLSSSDLKANFLSDSDLNL